MAAIDSGVLSGFFLRSGIAVGYTCNGFLYFPYNAGNAGFVMQDANGNRWQITIDTNGVLDTVPFTS